MHIDQRVVRRVERSYIPRRDAFHLRCFVARLRALAAWKGVDLELDVHPTVRVGRDVQIMMAPGTRLRVSLREGCQIGDRVTLALIQGVLDFGPEVQLRKDVSVVLSGTLEMAGANIFGFGCVLHVGERVSLGWASGAGEYASIADSAHFYSDRDTVVSRNTTTAPVLIGRNVFIAPRATIGKGVHVGDHVIIGPQSAVVRDVPSQTMVSGVPATVVRHIDLPWDEPPG